MTIELLRISISLLLALAAIIVLTGRFGVHAFFALLLGCFIVGLGCGMSAVQILTLAKEGFGNIMKALALIIVLGSTLGVILEQSGATRVLAASIVEKVGRKRAPLAMSLTGFIVGLPIFCDSGFIVLSGINNKLAGSARVPVAIMASSLGTGLYAVHCLIPPHPGAAAAAGVLGVDFGRLILVGICLAIPAMFTGYGWAVFAGRNIVHAPVEETVSEKTGPSPSLWFSCLPIIVPIMLIGIRSFLALNNDHVAAWAKAVIVLGDPAIALTIGLLLALLNLKPWSKKLLSTVLTEGVEKAGSILIIIGAGGAFGAVLAATHMGEQISHSINLAAAGLWFPFLVAFFLKTAQGSSTVAIITAASIVQPLLPALGLADANGALLSVLAMGAGSMMISHVNDAYFWVIARFSGVNVRTMLKVYSVATLLMGIITFLGVLLIARIF